MAEKIFIRRATAADATAISNLYHELVSDPSVRVESAQVSALAASANSYLLVAETHGSVGGTALLNLCADVMYAGQPFGVIENVVVASVQRGRGIGTALLAEIERLATEHDCTKLMLLSSQSRQEAHEFFQRCGFRSETKRAFVKYRRQFELR